MQMDDSLLLVLVLTAAMIENTFVAVAKFQKFVEHLLESIKIQKIGEMFTGNFHHYIADGFVIGIGCGVHLSDDSSKVLGCAVVWVWPESHEIREQSR
jgi:hypothetical protein